MDLHSYPVKYITPVVLEDGTLVQLRPIHPTDSDQADAFKSSLSADSLYQRFHGYVPPTTQKMVKQLTEIDYSREMAIVAEVKAGGQKEAIAVSRIAADGEKTAEFAVIISDKWQGRKIGTLLTDYMIEIAKDMGFKSIYALVLNKNTQMLEILRHGGFTISSEDEMSVRADLKLK